MHYFREPGNKDSPGDASVNEREHNMHVYFISRTEDSWTLLINFLIIKHFIRK